MSLWTATPVEASRELSVYHDISHVREALAARQLLCWSRGLMFAIVGRTLTWFGDSVHTWFGVDSQEVLTRKVNALQLNIS